jgi:cell division inhibitor SepF
MSAGIFDKVRKFFAMESDELEFDSPESLELRSMAENPRNFPGEQHPKSHAPVGAHTGAARKQEIVVFQPGSFNEAQQVAEHIKAHKTVIINMKKTDKDLARRIIDFLSGINYAVDGHVQKIADNIFLFAPAHVDVTMVDEAEPAQVEDPLFTRR